MNRKIVVSMALVLGIVVSGVMAPASHAAEKKVRNEVVMKMGNKVHLFHSGNVGAQKEIAINDVLPVYRLNSKTRQEKEVGSVKVLSFTGEHYFEAEIVKGEIKIGDIVKKDSAALLVQPAK